MESTLLPCLRLGAGRADAAAARGRPLPPATRTRRPLFRPVGSGGSPAASVGGGGKGHGDGALAPPPAVTTANNHADGRLPCSPPARIRPRVSARRSPPRASRTWPWPPSPPRLTRRRRRGARGTAASGSAGGVGDNRRRVRPRRLQATSPHQFPPNLPQAPTNAPPSPKPLHGRHRRRQVRPGGLQTIPPPLPIPPPRPPLPPPRPPASPVRAAVPPPFGCRRRVRPGRLPTTASLHLHPAIAADAVAESSDTGRTRDPVPCCGRRV